MSASDGRSVREAATVVAATGWVVRYATSDGREYSAHFPDDQYRRWGEDTPQSHWFGAWDAALRYAGSPSVANGEVLWLWVVRY